MGGSCGSCTSPTTLIYGIGASFHSLKPRRCFPQLEAADGITMALGRRTGRTSDCQPEVCSDAHPTPPECTSTRSSARHGEAKRGCHPSGPPQSPCHRVYVQSNRQQAGSCRSSTGSARGMAAFPAPGPGPCQGQGGLGSSGRMAHVLPEGGCPAPGRALDPQGGMGARQTSHQLQFSEGLF